MTERYACPQIDSELDEVAVYRSWLRVWSVASSMIGHGFDASRVSIAMWIADSKELEAEYGHDVAAACEVLRRYLRNAHEDDAARYLHYGLCSSDIVDAGWVLRLGAVHAELNALATNAADAIDLVGSKLREKALYRTHGQPAQVAPWRDRWRGLARVLRGASTFLKQPHTGPGEFGFDGPTGTGGLCTQAQRVAIAGTLKYEGMRARPTGLGWQAADRLEYARWLAGVAGVATACERFATNVRLLASTGEVSEGRGPGYRGSSSMPHKRNPTRSERICGLAPVIRGLVAGYTEAASSVWDAHSLEHSAADRVVIPQVCSLTGFVLLEVSAIARELEVDAEIVAGWARAAEATGDSFIERNRRILAGEDGGEAWVQTKEDALDTAMRAQVAADIDEDFEKVWVATVAGQVLEENADLGYLQRRYPTAHFTESYRPAPKDRGHGYHPFGCFQCGTA